jgi:hypothetical protein
VDHGFVVVGQGLVVADAAAVFGDPSDCSLDDPAAGQNHESGDLVGAFDDFDGERQYGFRPDVDDGAEAGAYVDQQSVRAVAVL